MQSVPFFCLITSRRTTVNCRYHLIYHPYDPITRVQERVLDLFQTSDALDAINHANAIPGSIALELEADNKDDVLRECAELGFVM
jgi:hypothetical protein